MRGVNRAILVGNATRDAELRHTQSGKPVASIRLATNRATRTASGERGEESQYHTVICWDTLAERTSRYVKKGDPLYVEGRIVYRTYVDSEGVTRGVTEIVASDVQFLGKRPPGDADALADDHAPSGDGLEVDLDDIPF